MPTVLRQRIEAGTFTAEVEGLAEGARPVATWRGERLAGLTVEPGAPAVLRLPIPAACVSDGVQAVTLSDEAGAPFHSFALMVGVPDEGDLRAEVELLRAELDLLKAAARRHWSEEG